MRDILIICPRFPPANAADAHRVRLSLPLYRSFGWNPIVLTADDEAPSSKDPMLLDSIPDDIEIVRVPIWRETVTRRFGFGQIDYRSFVPLFRAGTRLIRERKIALVFFSNTAFLSFALGPIWKKRFGCKIIYDFQDPWYEGERKPYTPENAPGSWRRYQLTQAIARRLEPVSMRAADHIISVSSSYIEELKARYPFLGGVGATVLPFPASELDYEYVARRGVQQNVFVKDGRKHWVYAGRGGPDMEFALSALFHHLRELKRADPDLSSKLQVHFVGTSYAPAGRSVKTIEPLARRFGVDDLVQEVSHRLPYFETLALYRDGDAVLLIGSDSADYTASKLFNCVLSGQPVLAIFHAGSLVTSIARELSCVHLTTFTANDPIDLIADEVAVQHRRMDERDDLPCKPEVLSSWLTTASTRKQAEIFNLVTTGQS
jgi:hypothetical protein